MHCRIQFASALALGAALMTIAAIPAHGAESAYPQRPIRLIIAQSPGGNADIVWIYGYFTVNEYFEAEFFGGAVKNIATFFAQADFFGEEDNTDAVPAE